MIKTLIRSKSDDDSTTGSWSEEEEIESLIFENGSIKNPSPDDRAPTPEAEKRNFGENMTDTYGECWLALVYALNEEEEYVDPLGPIKTFNSFALLSLTKGLRGNAAALAIAQLGMLDGVYNIRYERILEKKIPEKERVRQVSELKMLVGEAKVYAFETVSYFMELFYNK